MNEAEQTLSEMRERRRVQEARLRCEEANERTMHDIVCEIFEVEDLSELSNSGSYDGNGVWCSQQSEAANMISAMEMYEERRTGVYAMRARPREGVCVE